MPVPDYDNMLVGQYIRSIENPDSLGFRNGLWFKSPRKGDDPNNRGFGVDVENNKAAARLVQGRAEKWLTEAEERELRNGHIEESLRILDKWTPKILAVPPSEEKQAMAVGMLYRGDGIKSIVKDPTMRNIYYGGTDDQMSQEIQKYYNTKGKHYQPDRAKNHNKFFGKKQEVPVTIRKPESRVKAFDYAGAAFPSRYDVGGTLQDPKPWNNLSMAEKAEMIGVAVRNGITSLPEIRAKYNEFAEGGRTDIIYQHTEPDASLYADGGYMEKAKAMIRANEGWRSKPYKDAPKGKNWRSVGYGFNDSGFWERYPEGISKHYENGITKAQAEKELDYFLGKAERQLKGIYGKRWNNFNDDQKAAILDTYYQRPASVGSKSGFYGAVMSGKDGAPYLGVQGFGDRNQSRRDLYRGRGVTAPVSFESIAEPMPEPEVIHFEPLNPQVFGMQLPTYQAPVIDTIDTIDRIDTIDKAYDPTAIEKQERQDNLRRFGMFMSMLDGTSGQDSGMPDFIDMLVGKPVTYGKGGNLYDGTSEDSQQMQQGYIRQRPEGSYFYDVQGQPAIDVTPLNTSLSDNPADWTFTDASGKIYNPHREAVKGTGKLSEAVKEGPLVSAANNYFRELNWRMQNDPASIALQGKYTMPLVLSPILGKGAAVALANPYVDAALTSGFGAHGLNHWLNEGVDGWGDAAMTALEVTPLGRLAKPIYEEVVQPGMRLFNSPLTGNWTKIGNREYRLSPNSLGANGSPIESRKIGEYSTGIDLNKMRSTFEDYEKSLYQYKGLKDFKLPEYNYELPKIDFSNLVKDDFVDYLSQQTGRTLKRVPIKDTKHGDLYNEGFAFIDENGKEVAHIAGRRKSGKNVWVESSFVDPEFRYQGLGKQMYFDLNDHVFGTYGTTLHSDPYQRVGSTGAGMSPSNRLWKSLREKGLSSYEGEGFNRHDVMVEPSKITTAYRTSTTPQITAENAASITPEQWTAAQDAAIARGDKAEAQRLRDLHFKVSAPNTAQREKMYNASGESSFNEFNGGETGLNWFSESEKYAANHGIPRAFYINEPDIYFGNVPAWVKGTPANERYIEALKRLGYTDKQIAQKVKEINEAANSTTPAAKSIGLGGNNELVTKNNNTIKLADAVTFDDKGVRIPLGERDNFNLNDIRYGLLPFSIGLTGYGFNE